MRIDIYDRARLYATRIIKGLPDYTLDNASKIFNKYYYIVYAEYIKLNDVTNTTKEALTIRTVTTAATKYLEVALNRPSVDEIYEKVNDIDLAFEIDEQNYQKYLVAEGKFENILNNHIPGYKLMSDKINKLNDLMYDKSQVDNLSIITKEFEDLVNKRLELVKKYTSEKIANWVK